ncbi:MAG TPA: hypothetical protein VK987_03120 [Anaerolineae bacterium]|jgi:hypothetical protein|nr:hypothetical protein [Anaerolineae bacterium]
MSITTTRYAGHEAIRIDAGRIALMVTTSVGPRVLGLLTEDGRNHFAELPEMTLDCPGSGPIHLRGGSRLWVAPEDPRVTYRPDDDPVAVDEIGAGVRLVTHPDPVAGTARETSIRVTGPERLSFDYRVVNSADRPQRLAAWAITMMAPHGRAWLPVLTEPFDTGGFQAQRNIVLWSYARNDDPRFVLHDDAIELRAAVLTDQPDLGRFKVGTSLRRGWVAHWRDGVLLVKRAGHDESREYADMGASGQLYSQADFTELETLGPLTDLAPGDAAEHHEDWEVHLVDEAEAERLVASGELDRRAKGTP